MDSGTRAGGARGAALALTALLVAGCSHLPHWPWHHAPPPPPPPVHELDVTSAALDPASVRQFWKRNTLVVDLSAASGTGSLTLKPAAGAAWPVRLALRVTPGAVGQLEVHADQRLTLPISSTPGKPIDLELAPRMYTSKTHEMSVSWGPGPPAS